jgi:phosphodiesterase/alkaline phosphatase D-like protein
LKPKLKVLAAAVVAAGTVAGVAAAASSPSVVTGATSAVHSTSAVLHGTVNPNGRSTTYYFQWGLTNAYGAVSVSHSAGAGTKAAAVHVTATQLIPGTRYHYRLVATNGSGQSVGTDHTFKTAGHPPPGVATGPASGVSSTTATLTGVVNPNGATTTYEFQFGLTTAYGMQTTAATLTAGSVPVPVAQTVTGLTPGTVFHYRLVALHGATVSSAGIDGVLMTFPSKRPKAGITVHTKPGTDRKRPYSFTTSGNINRRNIPGHFACNGQVTVKYFSGRKRVGTFLIPLGINCTFSGKNTFRKLPRAGRVNGQVHLTMQIRYGGNGYLAPVTAKSEHITLG